MIHRILNSYYFAKIAFLFKSFGDLNYFCHRYNATWRNERVLEVPLAWDFLNKEIKTYSENPAKLEVLELGNVLDHYFDLSKIPTKSYTVVDKYEQAPDVINQDILDFSPSHKFDLIISVSTLEHIGWDEPIKEPLKTLKTIKKLKSLLKPGGKILVTFPLGHNPYLRYFVGLKKFPFNKVQFWKRISKYNSWKRVSFREIKNVKYNQPYCNANGVVVGLILRR
jgi:SAM-dependent methyltransferase